MAQLLVSVRSAAEAVHALAGGADVIDVKEPRLGSLGRADDVVISEVLQIIEGRRPVSAALGELLDENPAVSVPGLSFVKWGLAGCGRVPDWPQLLAAQQAKAACQVVHVAYADWQCAQAPPLQDVADLACRTPGSVLLVDTCCKTPSPLTPGRRPTLLDWFSVEEAINLCERCRAAHVRVALAGSIGIPDITLLRPAHVSWFAVRGAVCADGKRDGLIQECRVRELARLVKV
jgi:(5-formylfuran-3-yl)methyl phosphate synthase